MHLSNLRANAAYVANITAIEANRGHRNGAMISAPSMEKNNCVSSVEDRDGALGPRRCIELLADSGVVDRVGDPREFPEYAIKDSEGSLAGMIYTAANRGNIKNQGEQHLALYTVDTGFGFRLRTQSAAVSRPILSVVKLAEHGNDVVFRKHGGVIRHLATGREMTFERMHGVYVLRVAEDRAKLGSVA